MRYFYYYDWTILILIPPLILSLYAQIKVNSTYKRFSKISNARGFTARDVARRILDSNGLHHIQIEHINGNLTDHFDPSSNTVRLSDDVDNSTSVAAIGVAAHECGHAVQHAVGYTPIKIRTAMVPITNFSSKLSILFIIAGLAISNMYKTSQGTQAAQLGFTIAVIGICLFAVATVFQLITLPVEFNASSRALKTLEAEGILYDDELPKARKVLTAAALTYVAALISSIASLLRIILIVFSGNSRRN